MTEDGILSIVRRGTAYQVHYASFNPHDLERQPYPCPNEGALQTSSKHVGRICGVKSTHLRDHSHIMQSIEFIGVVPLNHARLAWKCA